MVIEYARNAAGIEGASSTEFDPQTTAPVIATMEEQKASSRAGDLGGTMRLGSYPAKLADDSVIARAYGAVAVDERHRHRYEVNNAARRRRRACASPAPHRTAPWSSSSSPRETHPYYVSTQAHPEFKSRPHRAHPLFAGLVEAAINRQRESRLVEVERPRRPRRHRLTWGTRSPIASRAAPWWGPRWSTTGWSGMSCASASTSAAMPAR